MSAQAAASKPHLLSDGIAAENLLCSAVYRARTLCCSLFTCKQWHFAVCLLVQRRASVACQPAPSSSQQQWVSFMFRMQVPASNLGTDLSALLDAGELADVTFTVRPASCLLVLCACRQRAAFAASPPGEGA